MKEIDLSFEHVSKRYVVKRERPSEGNRSFLGRLRSRRLAAEDFWAVREVSFAVERGEVLGIIGHNGAGKSTILKLLSSITSPTLGQIRINGRLAALIEVGSGFHPELTGRENIFLNGAILGMRRSEIAAKLDSIADFAGIQKFLDIPVKRFSSGMYVRLGFSIAAHLDPDILLLDEVLAVGDAAFQEKCLRRIAELREAGKTIVFISHDLAAVERICTRVILMRQGEIVCSGAPAEVIAEYQSHAGQAAVPVGRGGLGTDTGAVSTTLTLHTLEGRPPTSANTGGPLVAQLGYECRDPVPDVVFEVILYTVDRTIMCQLSTETSGDRIDLKKGNGTLTFMCDELALLPGLYLADVAVRRRGAPDELHWHDGAATLRVDPGKVTRGLFYQTNRWKLSELRELTEHRLEFAMRLSRAE